MCNFSLYTTYLITKRIVPVVFLIEALFFENEWKSGFGPYICNHVSYRPETYMYTLYTHLYTTYVETMTITWTVHEKIQVEDIFVMQRRRMYI